MFSESPVFVEGAVLVDASFVLALLDSEPEAQRYAEVLPRAVITSVNLGEVLYKLAELIGLEPDEAAEELRATGLSVAPVTAQDALRFAELKRMDVAARQRMTRAVARRTSRKSLSLADVCALAHAWNNDLPVLTGDRHWLALPAVGLPVPVIDYRDGLD